MQYYSEQGKKEFYRYIKGKIKIIQTLPEKEKRECFAVLNETIERYEHGRGTYLNSLLTVKQLDKIDRELDKVMQDLSLITTTTLFNLECIAKGQ